jgi:hypothetical protein
MVVVIHFMEENASPESAANLLCGECQRIGFTASRTSIQKRPSMNRTANQMRDAPIPWNMDYTWIGEA